MDYTYTYSRNGKERENSPPPPPFPSLVVTAGTSLHESRSPITSTTAATVATVATSTPTANNQELPPPSLVLSNRRSPWLPILESSNQLVLYDPTSHALSVTAPYLLPVPSLSHHHLKNNQRRVQNSRRSSDRDLDGEEETHHHNEDDEVSSSLAPVPIRHSPLSQLQETISRGSELRACPWCSRPFGPGFTDELLQRGFSRRAPNYFQLLEQVNYEAHSQPASPPSSPPPGIITPLSPETIGFQSENQLRPDNPDILNSETSFEGRATGLDALGHIRRRLGNGRQESTDSIPGTPERRFGESAMAQGYFAAFFKEEKRLGMGANGSVYLCQHVLDGNYLGHFAVKKIAVGHSHDYLLKILREVRLLETLRHPNVISYHHAWLETTRFSSFGPSIPTLHVLMEWAECGSLDDLIDARQGKKNPIFDTTVSGETNPDENETTTRSARIRAFKAAKKAQVANGTGSGSKPHSPIAAPGILLLSAEEIMSYLSDIVSGLAFLHDRSILHLDLKLGNVLMTKEAERIIPRAMLSDFGTSRDALQTPRVRSGNTGTVEYSAPEAIARDESGSLLQVDSKSDMWSLGMILHKLIFFRLPYPEVDPSDVNGIEREVLAYPGWKATAEVVNACKRRGLPRPILILLEGLLTKNSRERPTSERVLTALKEGNLESHHPRHRRNEPSSFAVIRRRSSSTSEEPSNSTNSTTDNLVSRRMSDPPPSIAEPNKRTSRSASPLLNRMHSPKRDSIPESIATLLLPGPMRVYAHTRWRTVRTCLLLVKILSLSRICQPAYTVMWMQALAFGAAVYDVWQEGSEDGAADLRVTAGLAALHVLILALIRWRRDVLCVI